MSTGIEFYDLIGRPLWNSTDININILGVYTISAGVTGSIPLPRELYNSDISLRRRNNLSSEESYNTGKVGSATVIRDGSDISVSYNTIGCQPMVLEIHMR